MRKTAVHITDGETVPEANVKRGFPSQELCFQRLEHYDRLIAECTETPFLREQRDWWARQLENVQRFEKREFCSRVSGQTENEQRSARSGGLGDGV